MSPNLNFDFISQNYREAILNLADKYNAENVRIFGSVARGEAKESSDIDILVHFRKGASLLDEAALDHELNKLLNCRVDLVADDSIKEELKPYILNDLRPL